MGDELAVELLGHFELTVGGTRIEGIRTPRLESLVAYLLLHRDRPVARDQLAFTLWPDSSDAQALTNLRRELHLLRRALPEPDRLVVLDRRTVHWRPDGPFRFDVAEFEAAVERGRAGDPAAFEEAVRLYDGPLLPTCYDDWIEADRERLQGLQVEASERLVADLEERREYRRAMQLLRRLIQLDPLRESAYRDLMRIAAAAGDRSAGLQAYHAAVTNLRHELGVEPDAETRAAYERLLALDPAATDERPAAPSAPPATGRPRIGSATQPLIGRRGEWASLIDAWRTVADGPSKLLEIRGEAGIGKTRLLEELVRWCRAQGASAAYTRSYAAEGALAYAPIADWLRSEPLRGAIDRLEPIWQSELARVLPELLVDHPDLRRPAPMTESWQRKSLFEAIARAIRSAPAPVLLVLDDAQWTDGETLEWLHYFLREESSSRILIAAGVRSDEERASRPLTALLVDLLEHDQLIEVDLPALSEEETGLLASQLLGVEAGDDLVSRLFRETEGHPLYVVEVARGGMATLDRPRDADPSVSRLPPRILAAIGSRLDQLSEEATEGLEIAATIGRAFTFEVLEQASELEEAALVRALDELWQRQIVREQGLNSYDFGHDRIRDAAYARIGPRRRRLLHRRVAQALELLRAADLDTVSAQIAAHYDAAGLASKAIEWFERAAAVADRVSANVEEVRYLARAVELIGQRPPSLERDRDELRLQIALASPTVASRGYATGDFAVALDRARILAATVHDRRSEVLALNGLTAAQIVHGEVRRSLETGRAAVALVADYPELVTACEMSYAGSMTALGMHDDAVDHFERAVRAYLPERSIDGDRVRSRRVRDVLGVACAVAVGCARDEPSSGIGRRWRSPRPAVRTAWRWRTRTGRCCTSSSATRTRWWRGHGPPWTCASATGSRTTASGARSCWPGAIATTRARTAPARIEAALESLRSIGAEYRRPLYLAILADTHRAAGDVDRATSILGAALVTALANEDVSWLPEIHRLIAELGPASDREAGLRTALALARSHGSRSLALRAAISLARHTDAASDELREVLDDLPAGERSAEAIEAAGLLERSAAV